MKLQKKSQRQLVQIALSAATLVSTTIIPIINGLEPAAQAGSVPAKSADTFVDSIGVHVHLTYGGTPYERFDDVIQPRLQEIGIRHIRDGGHDDEGYINNLKKLAKIGVKSDLIFQGYSIDYVLGLVKSLPGVVEAIEGPNESDLPQFNFSYDGQKFPDGTRRYQNELYAAIKGDSSTKNLPVIMPSMGWGENADKLGYLEAGDLCNMHSYPANGQRPTYDIDSYFIPHAKNMCGDSMPMMVTETGYHNGVNDPESGSGISEQASSKYLPRLLLENFNRNIKRTYLYEFINEWDESGEQANYGLLRYDGTPKPAFTAIKNMVSLLKEPGAKFTPKSLDYTLSGDTDEVHSTLLQKSTGEFYLIMWQDATSWDAENKKDISVPNREVTVNLNTSISKVEVYEPKNSTTATLTQTSPSGGRIDKLTVAVADHPLIIKLATGSGNQQSGGSQNSSGNNASDVVTMYQHSNFGGKSQSFSATPGVYKADQGQLNVVGNDSISSLRVPKGLYAYVCEHNDSGLCNVYGAGDYKFVGKDLNDKISYIEVLKD